MSVAGAMQLNVTWDSLPVHTSMYFAALGHVFAIDWRAWLLGGE